MSKVLLIIRREFITRVRKRSFIVMTLLGPLLFGSFIMLSSWFQSIEDTEQRTIAVVDSSRLFINKIPDTKNFHFEYVFNTRISDIKNKLNQLEYSAILYIPHIIVYDPKNVVLYSETQPSTSLLMHITNSLERFCEKEKLKSYEIENLDKLLSSVHTKIQIHTIKISSGGEKKTSWKLNYFTAYISGFLIYIFIFLFSAQVMRGVIEEKSNRIVEIIVSSVKPFQLMIGKITGIALTGLLQFTIWVLLTFLFYSVGSRMTTPSVEDAVMPPPQSIMSYNDSPTQHEAIVNPLIDDKSEALRNIIDEMRYINWYVMITMFLIYFIGGYLLYGSLFAAIGSAADADTDIQQFVLPVTVPLILSVMVMINAINDPDSSISWWFSIIPFTSPIVMMARIPFGISYSDLALSLFVLSVSIVGAIWFASKIYRTGILMYGKKTSYRELWKWIRY